MTSLSYLGFFENGNSATMAVDLKNLCELSYLWLDGSLSSGNITEFIEKLPQCSSSKLFCLSLNDNNMTGIMPQVMGHLPSLAAYLTTALVDLYHQGYRISLVWRNYFSVPTTLVARYHCCQEASKYWMSP
jgi:deoxyxylulose-5-phosphate synthase